MRTLSPPITHASPDFGSHDEDEACRTFAQIKTALAYHDTIVSEARGLHPYSMRLSAT
jgi:hypothetical protein